MNFDSMNACIKKITDIKSMKESTPYLMPAFIIELIKRLLEPPFRFILDACYESGNLPAEASLAFAETEIKYTAWNEKSQVVEICNIKNDNEPLKMNFKFLTDEEFENPVKRYPFIYVNPPFGYTNTNSAKKRLENKFLLNAINSLEENGQCIAIVPNGLLGRMLPDDISLRAALIEHYQLARILLLPLFTFSSAEVYTSILEIKNTGEKNTNIEIYDLRNCTSLQKIKETWETSLPVCILKKERVKENDYVLLPEEYNKRKNGNKNDRIAQQREIKSALDILEKDEPLSLYEERNGQLTLFIKPSAVKDRKKQIEQILNLKYDFLGCQVQIFCSEKNCRLFQGKQLFRLKIGGKCTDKKKTGPNILYGAGGPYGTTAEFNIHTPPAILVGRVGSCGNVYKAWTTGFFTDNTILVLPDTKLVLSDFLLFLLHTAQYKKMGKGTGQPYITNNKMYSEEFLVPSLEDQTIFLAENRELIREIQNLEQELEKWEAM